MSTGLFIVHFGSADIAGRPLTPITVCVDWCNVPLARTAAVHSIHDVSAGAAGNPSHDDVFPPSSYDIVDAINSRRKELGAPLNRAWWDGSVVLDWPANSATPNRKTVWCPEPLAPDPTTNTTSWDLRALDIKLLNLQRAVTYPETTILQLRFPPPWVWSLAGTGGGLTQVGKLLGEHYADILDWYANGGFVDEYGHYHYSGHFNITFGYLEILNEIDGNAQIYGGRSPLNATRRYIQLYDQVSTIVRARHPKQKFVGNCLSGRGDSVVWGTFLNRSEHAPGTPWPPDAVSYHLYIGGGDPGQPFDKWFAGFVGGARSVLESAKGVTTLIKKLSPTTSVFVDEMGILVGDNVRAAMDFDSMRSNRTNTTYWNVQSSIYSLWAGELSAVGVDMFGASQLLGYPSGPPGSPVGVPAGDPKAGTPFQPQVTPHGNCPEMSLLDWETGLGNARWWTLKMLNDGLGHRTKGVMPSCTTSPNVYGRGFAGTSADPLPGPTNRAVLLANLANDTQTVLLEDANASTPLWLVEDKVAGYDAVPYATLTVGDPEGLVTLPSYSVALVFLDDASGCGTCSNGGTPSPAPSHRHNHTALSPDPATQLLSLQLVEPTDWLNFEDGLGPPCTSEGSCPQYNPVCHCTQPGCTMDCGTGGATTRCCGRNVSSLWTGLPHTRAVATVARPVQGSAAHPRIVGLSVSFRYISGSYPGARLGANFSIVLFDIPTSSGVGNASTATPASIKVPACLVDQKPAPPPPPPPQVATLWSSAYYDDWR